MPLTRQTDGVLLAFFLKVGMNCGVVAKSRSLESDRAQFESQLCD